MQKEAIILKLIIMTSSEKKALSERLALLYLGKAENSGLSPAEFTIRFFEIKEEIEDTVSKLCYPGR